MYRKLVPRGSYSTSIDAAHSCKRLETFLVWWLGQFISLKKIHMGLAELAHFPAQSEAPCNLSPIISSVANVSHEKSLKFIAFVFPGP